VRDPGLGDELVELGVVATRRVVHAASR